jgi:hypothetical protein
MQKTWGLLARELSCALQLRHGRFVPSIRQLRAPARAVDAPRPLRGRVLDWVVGQPNAGSGARFAAPRPSAPPPPGREPFPRVYTACGPPVTNALAPDRGSSGAAEALAPPERYPTCPRSTSWASHGGGRKCGRAQVTWMQLGCWRGRGQLVPKHDVAPPRENRCASWRCESLQPELQTALP